MNSANSVREYEREYHRYLNGDRDNFSCSDQVVADECGDILIQVDEKATRRSRRKQSKIGSMFLIASGSNSVRNIPPSQRNKVLRTFVKWHSLGDKR